MKGKVKHGRKRQVNRFLPFYLFTFLLLFMSCGDFFEFDSGDMTSAHRMGMTRHVVTLVEGDRYCIPVWFWPDSLTNNAVYWESEDDSIATFVNDTLVARREGLTRAFAFTTIDRLRDTCWVQVMPQMYVAPGSYPYEMMIYASVDIHGTPLTVQNQDTVVIAAYVGNELRGVGRMRQDFGIDYLSLRVHSPYPDGEYVQLRCYFRGQARVELFPDEIVFDGEHHGTLSSLYPLVLDDTAEEYLPDAYVEDNNPLIEEPDTTHVIIVEQ